MEAGNGTYPRIFALAALSVGDHVATSALVFDRSPSFVVNPLKLTPGAPIATANATGNPTVPNPPQVPQPNIPQSNAPEPPAIPGTPPLAAATPPELQPPAPPSPPPPSEQPAPLDLTVSPQTIAIATPTAVIQPPTPPVNPAPPGGARREARQRQAAAQKSGADSDPESQDSVGDLAQRPDNPTGAAMARRDRTRPEPSFSARERTRPEPSFTALDRSQPSAGAQGLLYGGGITLMALALALGWSHGRPTPRRRTPELPAPALAELRRRR